MKTFTITKEQISGLYNNANVPWHTIRDNFKDWFPDAFKEELEIGKWYVAKDDGLYFFKGINQKTYGFDYGRDFVTNVNALFIDDYWEWKPATKEEAESALIKEAKKRGFKEGVNFIPVNGKCSLKRNFERYAYIEEDNKLLFSNYTIFSNGKWAEVVKTETRFTNPNNYESALEDLQFVGENTRKEMSKVFRKLAETLDKE